MSNKKMEKKLLKPKTTKPKYNNKPRKLTKLTKEQFLDFLDFAEVDETLANLLEDFKLFHNEKNLSRISDNIYSKRKSKEEKEIVSKKNKINKN
jgi:hypothetical protein